MLDLNNVCSIVQQLVSSEAFFFFLLIKLQGGTLVQSLTDWDSLREGGTTNPAFVVWIGGPENMKV